MVKNTPLRFCRKSVNSSLLSNSWMSLDDLLLRHCIGGDVKTLGVLFKALLQKVHHLPEESSAAPPECVQISSISARRNSRN